MPSQVNPRGFFRLGSAARRRWRPRAELRAVCTAHSPDPMRAVRTAHSGSTHCPFGTHVRPMRAARAARIAPTAAARKSAARVADLGETGQPMQQEIRDGRSVPYQTQARRPSKWPCARPVTYVRYPQSACHCRLSTTPGTGVLRSFSRPHKDHDTVEFLRRQIKIFGAKLNSSCNRSL
jgi:hypothetical protein